MSDPFDEAKDPSAPSTQLPLASPPPSPRVLHSPIAMAAAATAVRSSNPHLSPSIKRKRDSTDHLDSGRSLKPHHTNGDLGDNSNDDDNATFQMLQGLQHATALQSQEDENARTAQAALAAPMQQQTYPPPEHSFDSSSNALHALTSFDDDPNSSPTGFSAISPSSQALMAARDATTAMGHNGHVKPAVGSPQWHQLRKDNHKEGKATFCFF